MLILDLIETPHSGAVKAHTHSHHAWPQQALVPAQESNAKRTYTGLLQSSYAPQSLELLGQGAFKRLKMPQSGQCPSLFNHAMEQ